MRWLVVAALCAAGVAPAMEDPAPGLSGAQALPTWRVTAPWTPAVAVVVARPWGPLDVRTDGLDARWATGPVAAAGGIARTAAGTVDLTTHWIGLEVRGGRVALRGVIVRRRTGVFGFDPVVARRLHGGLRWSAAAGVFGLVVTAPEEGGRRVLSRWSWEGSRGPLRWVASRNDRRVERSADVALAARLALTSALDVGLRVEPQDTLWSAGLGQGSWRLRVGRVVQGPREGASALRLEWRP